MTLAKRTGLADVPGYTPVVFTLSAFAAGVQVALLVQAIGPSGYPPADRSTLAWITLAVLGGAAVLNVPLRRPSLDLSRVHEVLRRLGGRRAVVLEPYFDRDGASLSSSGEQTNGSATPEPEEVLPTLSARVHSPLSAGPVVAPGETVPIAIEAEPEQLARDLTVTVEVHGPDGSTQTQRPMEGTQLTHEISFTSSGAFEIDVRLTHPRADPVSRTLTGRISSYREEVGRLFEELKETLAGTDIDVGPQSTPREVCAELDRIDAAGPDRLADLAVELEVALYGDQEIDRSTYETVHQALDALQLNTQEVPG